jgi:hypothetical protein
VEWINGPAIAPMLSTKRRNRVVIHFTFTIQNILSYGLFCQDIRYLTHEYKSEDPRQTWVCSFLIRKSTCNPSIYKCPTLTLLYPARFCMKLLDNQFTLVHIHATCKLIFSCLLWYYFNWYSSILWQMCPLSKLW